MATDLERRLVATFAAIAEKPGGDGAVQETAERDPLWRLVRDPSTEQRTVIVLRYHASLADTVIAETMRCSADAVRSHAERTWQAQSAVEPMGAF